MSKEFKVGDKVSHPMWGNGEVTDDNFTDKYPIYVDFEIGNHEAAFTDDGKYIETDISPSLHHGHGTFEIVFKPEPEPVYEWQWLAKRQDGFFDTTGFHTTEESAKNYSVSMRWKLINRIEESKREVQP